MRGSRVAAAIAFILTVQCLPIPRPADAAGPVTAWYRQDNQWMPIMSFRDAEACARAAQALATKSGAYVDCAEGVLPASATQKGHQDPVSLDVPLKDTKDELRHERHPALSCSLTGLAAVCKSY